MESMPLALRWLLVCIALFAAAVPIARLLFPDAPDRGAGLAPAVAVVVVTLTAFHVGRVRFGPPVALGVVLTLVALGALAHLVGERRPEVGSYAPRRTGESFAAFLGGFALLLAFRAYDPALSVAGGEQFLHLGLYNAVHRATELPPTDMWYAGEPVRYYYGLATFNAVLGLVSATPPEFVHNLAIATYFGSLVAATYSLCGWVAHERGVSRRLGAAAGVFFVALAGSVATAARIGFGLLPRETALAHGEPVFGAIRHLDYGEAVARQSSVAEWSWFYERYVVPDTLLEFPLYSFVKADMHGHTATTGVLVLAAALAFAVYRAPAADRTRRLGGLAAMGVVAGYFGVSNTWSLPAVVGLAWLALVFAEPHPLWPLPGRVTEPLADRGKPGRAATVALAEGWRTVAATLPALGVGAVGVALAAPFLLGSTPHNEGVGLFPPRTEAVGLVLVFGGFLGLFAAFLALRVHPLETWSGLDVGVLTVGLVAWVALAARAGDLGASILLVPLLAAGWVLLRSAAWVASGESGDADRAGFETVALVAGLGLVLSMELVHARVYPFYLERWNTTLKVGVQAWVLCGVAAGPVVALLARDVRGRLPPRGRLRAEGTLDRETRSTLRANAPVVVVGVAVVAVVLATVATGAAFTLLVTHHEVVDPAGDADPSLDGVAVYERVHPDEYEAIRWLDREVGDDEEFLWMERRVGTETIAEAPGEAAYTWANPASTLTGTPTVVGWSHQAQHRGDEAFESRVEQADRIYVGDGDPVLEAHGVEFVYVGPNERERYEGPGYSLDERLDEHPALSVAFENDEVTVYRVDHDRLGESDAEENVG